MDVSSQRRVSLLADMHLRHLREKMILKQRIDDVTRRIEVCHLLLLVPCIMPPALGGRHFGIAQSVRPSVCPMVQLPRL